MKLHSTFLPNPAILHLLTQLFCAYRALAQERCDINAPRLYLIRLKEAMDGRDFECLQSDLVRLMRRKNAWRAVQAVISDAMRRKQHEEEIESRGWAQYQPRK